MRRAATLVITVLVAALVAGVVALRSPGLRRRLPTWVQTRPTFYLDDAIETIRTHAVRRDTVDWPAAIAHATELARDAKTATDTYPAIRYVLGQLHDGASTLMPPPSDSTPPGAYGMMTLFPDNVVAVVYPQSAAAQAGVKAGDIIEAVNGAPPVASVEPRARGYFVSIPPPSATLRLRHPGEKESHEVRLQLGSYVPLPAFTALFGKDLGYVEIPATGGAEQFAEKVQESIFQRDGPAVCGWIVDLRFNNGGELWSMLQGLRPLLGDGSPGAFSRNGQLTAWSYPTSGPFGLPAPTHTLQHPDPPIAVLTSRLTANAGELTTIAFRGRPGTRTFGEPTWGAATENTSYPLADRARLDLATANAADRTGHVYDGRIPPDEPVAIDWARLTAENDPVIVAAGTWLRTQPPCRK